MMFLAWYALFCVVAVFIALTSCIPLAHFVQREWRLMTAMTWEPGGEADPRPGTRRDPRVRRMVMRQRIMGLYMRNAGIVPRVDIGKAWAHDENAFRFARRT